MTEEGKPTVYVDMDDTAVMFSKQLSLYNTQYPDYQYPQSIIGFFSSMEPMPGFLEAWKVLGEHYDMAFCTRPSVYNLGSYTEKAVWVRDNVGFEALENLNLVPKKERIGEEGDYLIDDWDIHGQTKFRGYFIRFGSQGKFKSWKAVAMYLLEKAGLTEKEIGEKTMMI
jgi:5'-nucleotidase